MKHKLENEMEEKVLKMLESGFSKEEILEKMNGNLEVLEILRTVNALEHVSEDIPIPSFAEFKEQFAKSVQDSEFESRKTKRRDSLESPYGLQKIAMYLGGGIAVVAIAVVSLSGNISVDPYDYYANDQNETLFEEIRDFDPIEANETPLAFVDKEVSIRAEESRIETSEIAASINSQSDEYTSDQETPDTSNTQGQNEPQSGQVASSSSVPAGGVFGSSDEQYDTLEEDAEKKESIPFKCSGVEGSIRNVNGEVVVEGNISSLWSSSEDAYGFFQFTDQSGGMIYAKGGLVRSSGSGFSFASSILKEQPNAIRLLLLDGERKETCEVYFSELN